MCFRIRKESDGGGRSARWPVLMGIRILVDDGSGLQATEANIRQELQRLVRDAGPWDLLFFHYSGHGSMQMQLPAKTGQDDDTEYDKRICPARTLSQVNSGGGRVKEKK